MEDQEQTSFTFEIDNLSEKESVISSPNFLSGGCEWAVEVYPKGKDDDIEDHLSLYLFVGDPKSLRLGWKRRATSSFILFNHSGKELYRSHEHSELFCAQFSGWGVNLPLKKLQEKGFLEKNKLIVKLQVKVVEVVDEDARCQWFLSSLFSVTNLFTKHPDIAQYFRPRSQLVKTAYINLLLRLIETLNKPPHSISDTELSNACSELIELTETGFKLDWLIKKLGLVSLERKKDNADVSPVQELEEFIKNLKVELHKEKVKYATSAEKVLWLENTIWTLRREMIDDKAKSAAKGLLEGVVHSWNEWKVRLGFADLHNDKTD